MSRLGKLPVVIPEKVKAQLNGKSLNFEGPKGKLSYDVPEKIDVKVEDGKIVTTRQGDSAQDKALHGLARTLIFNMIKGVHEGFEKKLEIKGVGYRAAVKGTTLNLSLGFSHPVDFPLPETVTAKVEANTTVILQSPDKSLLGNTAAKIRSLRPPEPYQGKGIKYSDEHIRRKAGKSAAK